MLSTLIWGNNYSPCLIFTYSRRMLQGTICVLETNHKNKARKMKQFMLSMKETVGAELRLPEDHVNA